MILTPSQVTCGLGQIPSLSLLKGRSKTSFVRAFETQRKRTKKKKKKQKVKTKHFF
jgi:hypothetical protein